MHLLCVVNLRSTGISVQHSRESDLVDHAARLHRAKHLSEVYGPNLILGLTNAAEFLCDFAQQVAGAVVLLEGHFAVTAALH